MKTLAALAIVALAAGAAEADSLEHIIGDRAAVGLPAGLTVTTVHVPRALAHLDVDAATVDVDFPSAARIGRASVKVRIGGKRARTVFVPITIARVADVAIATRQLAPGELVTAADVRWERRAGVTGSASPVGQQASASIAAGEVLDDARLTAPPPVARGTEVRVQVRRGVVVIHTRGKLEQAARLGTLARVRLSTGSFVSGRLATDGLVIVEAL